MTKHKDGNENGQHPSLPMRYVPIFNGFCVSFKSGKPYFTVYDMHEDPFLIAKYITTFNPFVSQHKDDCERLCNKLNQVLEDWPKGVRSEATKNVDDAGTPY